MKLLVIAFLFLSNKGFSQIKFINVNNKEAKSTFLKLNSYLLSHPVPDYKMDMANPYAIQGAEKFTDSVISLLYDKKIMDSVFIELEKKGGQQISIMYNLQRISLSVLSKNVHCLPQDSVFVMSEQEYNRINKADKESGFFNLKNVFIAGFITKSKFNDYFTIALDNAAKKIVMITPIIHFELAENNEAVDFLKRNCQ